MAFYTHLHLIPQALIISMLFCAAFLFVRDNKGQSIQKIKDFIKHDIRIILFLSYSALVFTGTVISRPYTNPYTNVIGDFYYDKWGRFNFSGLINIMIFVPYTFLYILALNSPNPFKKSAILIITTTIIIELFQLLFWVGQFSIADMMFNIIGGMLGYGIWRLYKFFIRCKKQK